MVWKFIYSVFFFSLLSLSAQRPAIPEDLEIHEDKKEKVNKVETQEVENPEEILKIDIGGEFAAGSSKKANFGLRKQSMKGKMPKFVFYALIVVVVILSVVFLYRLTHFLFFVKAKYVDHEQEKNSS